MDVLLLPDRTITEIAMRCGRGWFRAQKPQPAESLEWQMSRIENFRRVIERAPQYARGHDGLSRDSRNAMWVHVCMETDLHWKAAH